MRDYQSYYKRHKYLYDKRLEYLKEEYIYYPKYIFDYINLGAILTLIVPVLLGLMLINHRGYDPTNQYDVEFLGFVVVLIKFQMFFSVLEVVVVIIRLIVLKYLKKTDEMLQYYTENMNAILGVYSRRRRDMLYK